MDRAGTDGERLATLATPDDHQVKPFLYGRGTALPCLSCRQCLTAPCLFGLWLTHLWIWAIYTVAMVAADRPNVVPKWGPP
jgi:hypothetical protein